jgi:hypothetical protein
LIVVTLFMVVGAIFLSSREGAMRYGLFTSGDMFQFLESTHADHNRATQIVADYWRIDRDWIAQNSTNIVDIAFTTHGVQFSRLLNASLGFAILGVLFAPYYIGMDFKSRLWNNMLYVGHKRARIFSGRVIAYFTLVILFSLVTTFILIVQYSGTVFDKLPSSEIWSGILKKIVYDAAYMSVPLAFVYLFKGAVYPALCTLAVNGSIWIGLNVYGKPNETQAFSQSPVNLPMKIDTLPSFNMTQVPIVAPALIIMISVALAYYFFKRADLY